MSYIDLKSVLDEWSYDPEQISVRKIIGADGRLKIQMRVELGVLQMEAEERPDGAAPHGDPSLLDHHLRRLATYEDRNGTSLGFALSPGQCEELRAEASMYYRRFVSSFVLEEYDSVYRDTSHNLGVFDLCRDYALEPDDRRVLESYRPYALMMDARAHALQALADGEPSSALAHVNRGIMNVKIFFAELDNPAACEAGQNGGELRILRALAKEIGSQMPDDSLIVTRKALRVAIEEERYEEAARLRDALKELGYTDV